MQNHDSNTPDGQPDAAEPQEGSAARSRQPLPGAEDNFGLSPKPKAKLKKTDPLLGVDLGGVTIVRLIGEGGMGRVYEARQASPDRVVAVKIVRQGITNDKTLRRFEREAEFLGKLQHPAIAQIFAVGVYESDLGDVPFFVMEHVRNARPITSYIHDEGLGLPERLRLFKRVCDAIAHGHDRGIVHRDLKPGNILISADGTPKVIDFGVARSTDSDLTLTKLKTDTGALVGTLQYMSPEQFGDSAEALDGRADVYSLGVVLYELVSGSLPYEIRKKAMHEASRIVCEEIPPSLRSRDKSCPRDVSVIAERCLQKDRNHRYHGAGELAAELEKFLDGKAISAGSGFWAVRQTRRASRLLRSGKVWLTVGLTAGVVLSAIALGAWTRGNRDRRLDDAPSERPGVLGYWRPSRTPAEEFKGRLTTNWSETAISVSRGEGYKLNVLGVFSGDSGPFGADGNASVAVHSRFGPGDLSTSAGHDESFVDGFPRLAVMARIGGDARLIYVGKELTFIAPASGRLAFRLNAASQEASQAGGDVTITMERVRDPEFREPDGTTSIRARVHGKEFLVFHPDGLQWVRQGPPELGPEYPVLINNVAWWPDWISPTESAVLKTRDFSAIKPPPGRDGHLPALTALRGPAVASEASLVEFAPGVLSVRFVVDPGWYGEIAWELPAFSLRRP